MNMYGDELEFAVNAVRRAASLYKGRSVPGVEKTNGMGIYDLVTDLDTEAERLLRNAIEERYPEDRFVGEETSSAEETGGRTWIVDPIDGTVNFVRGIPMYGTQLALAIDGEPVMSVIYLPEFDEMYTATAEDGARLNGKPLKMKPCDGGLHGSIVAMCDFSRRDHRYREVQYDIIGSMYDKVARMKMFGAACCDFAFLASGRVDVHFRYMNHIWDFLPGMFVCRCAGAYIHPELLKKNFLLITSDEAVAQEFCSSVLKNIEV